MSKIMMALLRSRYNQSKFSMQVSLFRRFKSSKPHLIPSYFPIRTQFSSRSTSTSTFGQNDLKEIIQTMKKRIQERPLDPKNYVMLGIFLFEKEFQVENFDEAKIMFEKAAELGSNEARNYCGVMYEYGLGSTKQDFASAVKLYHMAADAGYAPAISNLGFCYAQGRGVNQDSLKAFELYKKAALLDYIDAQFNLGNCYLEGRGCEQSFGDAMDWYLKCATKNHARACNNIGIMFEHGLGVDQSYETALNWFEKAVSAGDTLAQQNILRVKEQKK